MTGLTSIRFCQLAATVVTVYDHVITIDQEVDLVWNKHWTTSKVLLIWSRYFGDFVLLAEAAVYTNITTSHKFCYVWFRFHGWAGAFVIWSMQLMMMSRIFALYPQSRKVLILVLACFISQVAATSTVLALAIHTFVVPPRFHICAPHRVPKYFCALWIPIILFEILLFALSLNAWIAHLRRTRRLKPLQSHDLVSILVRDSVAYFFVILVAYIANAVSYLVLPVWNQLPDGLSLASTCVIGCRLMLNLREAYYLPFSEDSDTHHALSDFRTAERIAPSGRQGGAGTELTTIYALEVMDPG